MPYCHWNSWAGPASFCLAGMEFCLWYFKWSEILAATSWNETLTVMSSNRAFAEMGSTLKIDELYTPHIAFKSDTIV